ncbi:hypothetical protein [Paenirhodobacter sp.]|uniref:hypothetical protein n=1 Tax=Paenirhodobacter sp. TaxID=1965326 RepID=UPI003B4FF9E8
MNLKDILLDDHAAIMAAIMSEVNQMLDTAKRHLDAPVAAQAVADLVAAKAASRRSR